jgi:hypothetical protein
MLGCRPEAVANPRLPGDWAMPVIWPRCDDPVRAISENGDLMGRFTFFADIPL